MTRLHAYVITSDDGAAPNYDAPAVTLAVCKLRIRRKARVGDVILAFTGRSVGPEPHAVCWAGVVSEVMTHAEYWNDARFARKKPGRSPTPDNIYRPRGPGLAWVDNPVHGRQQCRHDTSGINVLVLSPAWRFGAHGPILPATFRLRMTNGRRGERLFDLDAETWEELRKWLEAQPQIAQPRGRMRRGCSPPPRRRETC